MTTRRMCFTAPTTVIRMVHSANSQRFARHYDGVSPARREGIHMVSVVGGLYGLNLIPLWRPTRLTFFDINPTAVTYFRMIHRLFLTSDDVEHFLRRLTDGDYDAETEAEQFVRENIRLKQQGCLPRSRGSTKRSYPESWKIAFDQLRFDQTNLEGSSTRDSNHADGERVLQPVDTRTEQPLDLLLEHHSVPLFRPGVCRPEQRRPGADHPSRAAPASGPGAAERRGRPGPLRDSPEGGAHRS